MEKVLELPRHPFFIGPVDPGTGDDLPKDLPFALGVHPEYAIPRLVLSDEIRDAIQGAYAIGSMCSTPLGESQLATVRMNDFVEQLVGLVGGSVEGLRLLEVGCGNGELLNRMRSMGAIVTGLEIGPQAQVVEDRFGIRVIREPLGVGTLEEDFDCIYSYGCLEHIDDLDDFFAASRTCLAGVGLFCHSVPNAALSFEQVALDHLHHEHINYFTPENGVALFEAQCFSRAGASVSKAGNELMIWGFHEPGRTPQWPSERVPEETLALRSYAEGLELKVARTLRALRQMVEAGQTIGFYAGGFEYGALLDSPGIRYFDGDTYKHGKQWLRGLSTIEPPAALRTAPVDLLVVCKPHYLAQIQDGLACLGIQPMRVITITDLPACAT
jgi:SAM-dependent methyltransferase